MAALPEFTLHPRLEADTTEVLRLELCRVLLMNDRANPWLILVPEREGVTELHALGREDRAVLMEEIALASRVLESLHRPDKLNVGALGNLVSQLHIHIIARFTTDRAWPGPIWGTGPVEAYEEEEQTKELTDLRKALLQH